MTQIVAEVATSTMSNMEKILAMAPSLDEEEVKKFKLSNTKRKGAKTDRGQVVDMDQIIDTEPKVIEEQISTEANRTEVDQTSQNNSSTEIIVDSTEKKKLKLSALDGLSSVTDQPR